jgi:hypothetical protein
LSRAGLINAGTTVLLLLSVALGVRLGIRALGEYRFLSAPNDWMAPVIPEGSLVVLDPVLVQELKTGDVIAYRHPSRPDRAVLLRIVDEPTLTAFAVAGRLLRLHGDSASAPTEPWDAEFQGSALRVRAAYPGLGRFAQLGAVPPALIAPLAVPPVLLRIG